MRRRLIIAMAAGVWLAAQSAFGATVNVTVTSDDGRPAENAVVELFPQATSAASVASKVPAEAIVDQRHETFLPLVSLIRRDGHVVFTNNDTTMHQVYSFSDIKQFAFEIDQGQRSSPVVFDKPGVAAVGCNIHDQMITYVYVATTPWVVRTGSNGQAEILDVPAGAYRAAIWHPQLAPGRSPAPIPLLVSGDNAKLTASLAFSAPDPRAKKHMHMQGY
jgi:plastocyanin